MVPSGDMAPINVFLGTNLCLPPNISLSKQTHNSGFFHFAGVGGASEEHKGLIFVSVRNIEMPGFQPGCGYPHIPMPFPNTGQLAS